MAFKFNPFTGNFDIDTTATRKTYQNPSETPNGIITTFTAPDAFKAASLAVFVNGIQEYNVSEISTTQFSFTTPPATGDIIKLDYILI